MGTTEIKVKSMDQTIKVSKDVGDTVYVDFSDIQGECGYGNLTKAEVYEFITVLATKADLFGGYRENSDGLFVRRPLSEATLARRDELSQQFFGCNYVIAGNGAKSAVDYIIEDELERGDLV